MKKIAIAALAALTLGAPALAQAQPFNRHHDGRGPQAHHSGPQQGHYRPAPVRAAPPYRAQRMEYRNWRQGQRFDQRYAYRYRVINSPNAYRLRPAPRGYRWVQSGNDAVLIAITSGLIAQVLANRF